MRLVKRSRTQFLKKRIELFLFDKYISMQNRNHIYKFFVQPGDRIANDTTVQGLFEPYEIASIAELIDKFIAPRNKARSVIALDIGANIGSYSVALAHKFKKILAFEPNKSVFKVLEANIILNRIHNVFPYEIALGDKGEIVDLYETEEWNTGMASLTRYQENARVISSVTVAPGDEIILPLLKPEDLIGFVKIDVEGHERKVIRGLKNILSEHKPIISLEIRGDQNGSELKEELRGIGYDYFYWVERRKRSAITSKSRRLFDFLFYGSDFYLQPVENFENTFYASIIASDVRLM